MLADLLLSKRVAIGERWLKQTLTSYRPDAAGFLRQQKNRFANPVGQTFAERIHAIVEGLLTGADPRELCGHLEEIVKIRAIQDFTPAEAVSFIFLLKDAIRDEMPDAGQEPEFLTELRVIEARVDQLALFTFDIFVKWREKVYSLRLREIRAGMVQPT